MKYLQNGKIDQRIDHICRFDKKNNNVIERNKIVRMKPFFFSPPPMVGSAAHHSHNRLTETMIDQPMLIKRTCEVRMIWFSACARKTKKKNIKINYIKKKSPWKGK